MHVIRCPRKQIFPVLIASIFFSNCSTILHTCLTCALQKLLLGVGTAIFQVLSPNKHQTYCRPIHWYCTLWVHQLLWCNGWPSHVPNQHRCYKFDQYSVLLYGNNCFRCGPILGCSKWVNGMVASLVDQYLVDPCSEWEQLQVLWTNTWLFKMRTIVTVYCAQFSFLLINSMILSLGWTNLAARFCVQIWVPISSPLSECWGGSSD